MTRWIRNGVIGFVGLVVVLVVGGALYQYVGNAIDQRRYSPPGKLVDVDGHRLHLYCTGEGSPTVVMDAMGQGWSVHWSRVQPAIAKFTRVCSYDSAAGKDARYFSLETRERRTRQSLCARLVKVISIVPIQAGVRRTRSFRSGSRDRNRNRKA